jgi:hypothetical protein
MSRENGSLSRRRFLQGTAFAGAAALGAKHAYAEPRPAVTRQNRPDPDSIHTNIESATVVPRTEQSMPGKYPGVVAEVYHPESVEGNKPDAAAAAAMLAAGMTLLTGDEKAEGAWSRFFTPQDRVGIKVNPVAGRLLANSHELTHAIIDALLAIGLPKENIILWDRRQEQLKDCGFTEENYPGITIIGTEYMEKEGEQEVWKGLDRLDEDFYYEFDIAGEYDEELMPYMLNGGTKSYFTRIITQMVDKVINVPILKNAGTSVTIALKNLAFGTTSNSARGHNIWSRYIAEVCAFPPVRDKVVLNIVDGLRGCYEGGPGAVARYIWNAKTVWVATDPVAVDHIGWEKIFAKRVAEGVSWEEQRGERDKYLDMLVRANKLGLGVYERSKIDHRTATIGQEKKG